MKMIARKILIISVLCEVFAGILFSQNGDYTGGFFTKTIEYNLIDDGYNFNNKSRDEKRLFGDFNAPVEFFNEPLQSSINTSDIKYKEYRGGFRIRRDSLAKVSYVIEIKRFVDERIEKQVIRISDEFAEKFYNKMVSIIYNFKATMDVPIDKDGLKLDPNMAIGGFVGGHYATFRTVVQYEVWTLKMHAPIGSAGKMDIICRQILKETESEKFIEANYLKLLDDFLKSRQILIGVKL